MKRSALATAATLAALVAWPSSAGETDHGDRPHHTIRILESRVVPRTVELTSTEALSWLNYSSRRARISFDSKVAMKMTCKSAGSFRIDGQRLTTADVQATQFASLCSLAPGEYEYRVDLRHGVGGSGSGTDKSLRGRIVVSE